MADLTTPSAWYKVEVCSKCQVVTSYFGTDTEGVEKCYVWSPNYSSGRCRHCGCSERYFEVKVAAWYFTGYWYMPWTWFVGEWELQETRQQRLAAEKFFEPIRNRAKDSS